MERERLDETERYGRRERKVVWKRNGKRKRCNNRREEK